MELSEILDRLNNTQWSTHCVERMQSRNITRDEVVQCIKTGEIIESYPNDFPYPSCLIYGVTEKNKILHVVLGLTEHGITIITVYEPNINVFQEDMKTRR